MSSETVPPATRSEFIIEAEGLGKAYRIWDRPASRLIAPGLESLATVFPDGSKSRRWLADRARQRYRDFHALRDVSFRLRRGESLGIVGRNGSGKSTLLQIITGTLEPTTGNYVVRGRVAALLELGSGFNPEFTGRENVFLNASILGLTRQEVEERFDSIAAYADIGEFIEQPVKTYSSGMQVRLAFAVAAHVDAEILIIDEALSVGDARFQLKCARTLDEFMDQGRTLLFVSHDTSAVNRLCSAGMLLDGGRMQILHEPRQVTNLYTRMMADPRGLESIASDMRELQAQPFTGSRERPDETSPPPRDLQEDVAALKSKLAALHESKAMSEDVADRLAAELEQRTRELAETERALELLRSESEKPESSGREFVVGGESANIRQVELLDVHRKPRVMFSRAETALVRIVLEARQPIPRPVFALRLRDAKGIDIYGTNSYYRRISTEDIPANSLVEVTFSLQVNLVAGTYFVSVGCSHFEGEKLVVHHRRYDVVEFQVAQDDLTFGIAECFLQISARPLGAPPTPTPPGSVAHEPPS